MNLDAGLSKGIEALALTIAPQNQQRLLQYLALIVKWNQVHNLTAVREPEKMLTQHLLDSLAVVPHIAGPRIADVGSGAGLPGIPLALARPDWSVVLIESNHKKAAFLQQARIELKLENIEIVTERVEHYRPAERFDTVISRAFSDVAEFVTLAGHLCADAGRLAAMKGIYPHEELAQPLAQPPDQFTLEKVVAVAVPGLAAERHLVLVKRT